MCGIGTTLVEAVHLGRHAVGVELEPRWADLARANITHARTQGATGTATVVTGDARQLPSLLDPGLVGQVALVLTSPPYGSSIHGQVTARPGRGVAKYDNTYSPNPGNLGRVSQPALLDALGHILAGCQTLLRPGGLLVLTARPYRHHERLVDLPGQLTQLAEPAGLMLYERNAALLVGLRGDRLVPRPSFFQLDRVRKARARGCHCGSSPTKTSWSSGCGAVLSVRGCRWCPRPAGTLPRRYRVEACAGHRGSLTQARRLSRR